MPGFDMRFEGNAARHWFTVRNPLRIFANVALMVALKYAPPMELKNHAYRLVLGMKIGSDVAISPDVIFDPIYPELIEIGDGCLLGWGARIFTHECWLDRMMIRPVKLGRKVFIGGFSVVRPGVTLGDGVFIASNSFVNRSIGKKGVYGGVPAKQIREKI